MVYASSASEIIHYADESPFIWHNYIYIYKDFSNIKMSQEIPHSVIIMPGKASPIKTDLILKISSP